MQESSNFQDATTWNTPRITWNPGVAVGTSVTVPTTMRQTTAYASTVVQPVADSAASVAPLYDQPGKGETLDPNSLQRPIGCQAAGGTAAATSFDTPNQLAPATFAQAVQSGGVVVGQVTWTNRVNTTRVEHFRTFCVVFNTVTNQFCALRQATWDLNVDSAAAGDQHATANPDGPATVDPATGVNANDVNQPTTAAAVGAATTTFTKR